MGVDDQKCDCQCLLLIAVGENYETGNFKGKSILELLLAFCNRPNEIIITYGGGFLRLHCCFDGVHSF